MRHRRGEDRASTIDLDSPSALRDQLIGEVIDLPRVPAQVTEHVFIARVCPRCRRNCLPQAELDGAALGKQRLGVNLVSLIATLREEGRLPIRSIQWYLRTVHQLRLSVGAIVAAIHRMAQQARPAVSGILERIRGSPVVHADETGWRENGANGYVWTFSTPTDRYFLRRGRGKSVVDEVLGDGFAGVLVCDFYAAYHHYDGPKQRCWAHLLRDIHDLQGLYPDDGQLAQWAEAVHGLYAEAKAFAHPKEKQRRAAQQVWEQRLLAIGRPFLDDRAAVQAKLCRRIERHIKELFVFVGEPAAPSDNNAAERSLRHLVVSRKVSGGTRSAQGTDTKDLDLGPSSLPQTHLRLRHRWPEGPATRPLVKPPRSLIPCPHSGASASQGSPEGPQDEYGAYPIAYLLTKP